MTLDELRIAANHAEQLLKNEAFTAAIPRLREEFTKTWYQSKSAAAREECWLSVKVLDDLIRMLGKPIQDYKVAEANAARNRSERTTGEPV